MAFTKTSRKTFTSSWDCWTILNESGKRDVHERDPLSFSFQEADMSECVVCGSDLELNNDIVAGELVDCDDCGSELEIASLNPITIQEAPTEEEDWGQ